MNTLNQLINDLEEAERQAEELVKGHRDAAYLATLEEQASLTEQLSDDTKQSELLGLIEKALNEVDENTAGSAALVVAQFVSLNVQHPDVRAGNGMTLLDVFADAAKGLPDETRQQALTSLLLIATGKTLGGLYRFPADPLARCKLATLRVFASILDPKAFERICSTHLKKANDLKEVNRYVEQFAPAKPSEPEPAPVKILNVGEGTPLQIGSIKLPGYGKVTEISAEQYDEIQGSDLFKAGLKTHSLEVLA
ncbi:MAG: hypothetical protein KZQ85_14730 [Candidatus Thiodiazotropha sp. (ex Myrtea sp. 'scaly one' KF741663)]|nr:hypothetical protein [Candidatus Thiodiazotropha sp. (ex Myrtea sp. 'scaly one' KF741663)]